MLRRANTDTTPVLAVRPLVSLGQTATRALLARARRKSESRDRERDCTQKVTGAGGFTAESQ